MGFRFRKSIKIAPGVKLNLNKKSASLSFGGKGIRHTISSTGRRTSSVGIPGTGLYYTKSTSAKKSKKNRKNNIQNNTYIYEDPYLEVKKFNNFIESITSFHKQCDYNFNLIDPFDALNNFEHNVRFLKTKGFQEVEKINI